MYKYVNVLRIYLFFSILVGSGWSSAYVVTENTDQMTNKLSTNPNSTFFNKPHLIFQFFFLNHWPTYNNNWLFYSDFD